MATLTKLLFVPIEIKARELVPKIAFSCLAACHGWTVVCGREDLVHAFMIGSPPGLFFAKNIGASKLELLRLMASLGHRYVVLDEEAGIIYRDLEQFFRLRFSSEGLNGAEEIFLWSEDQKRQFDAGYESFRTKAHAFGSPRLDHVSPKWKVLEEAKEKEYRVKYGKYVLFSSNFSINNSKGSAFLKNNILRQAGGRLDEAQLDQWISQRKTAAREFFALLDSVAKAIPDSTIIVRPHPAEDLDFWRPLVEMNQNVYIERGGSLLAAARGACAVLHSGCTAALEAVVNNVPAIDYRLGQGSMFESSVASDVSYIANDFEEVIRLVESALEGSLFVSSRQREALGSLKRMFDGACSQRILANLDSLAVRLGAISSPVAERLRGASWRALCKRPYVAGKLLSRDKMLSAFPSGRIIRHKCDGISLHEVERVYQTGVSGGLFCGGVNIQSSGDDLFVFEKAWGQGG